LDVVPGLGNLAFLPEESCIQIYDDVEKIWVVLKGTFIINQSVWLFADLINRLFEVKIYTLDSSVAISRGNSLIGTLFHCPEHGNWQ
jgi:hypothetical protein